MRYNYTRKASKFGRMASELFEELYGENNPRSTDENNADLRGALLRARHELMKAAQECESLAYLTKTR